MCHAEGGEALYLSQVSFWVVWANNDQVPSQPELFPRVWEVPACLCPRALLHMLNLERPASSPASILHRLLEYANIRVATEASREPQQSRSTRPANKDRNDGQPCAHLVSVVKVIFVDSSRKPRKTTVRLLGLPSGRTVAS